MGYSFTIGEAEFEYFAEDNYLRIGAKGQSLDTAPTFPNDEMTGNGNGRSPSYTGWHEFCREVGLELLFYGSGWSREARRYQNCPDGYHRETPLLVEHPGAQPLCAGDLAAIREALEARKSTSTRPPGFEGWNGENAGEYDGQLARLIWLEFWVAWALENCRIPVLANT